jgi:hypothetical protein
MTKKRQSIGTTLGGVIVGLDYMIFKTGKPPAEQVESAKPSGPVAADDGGTLSIDLPDDLARGGVNDLGTKSSR